MNVPLKVAHRNPVNSSKRRMKGGPFIELPATAVSSRRPLLASIQRSETSIEDDEVEDNDTGLQFIPKAAAYRLTPVAVTPLSSFPQTSRRESELLSPALSMASASSSVSAMTEARSSGSELMALSQRVLFRPVLYRFSFELQSAPECVCHFTVAHVHEALVHAAAAKKERVCVLHYECDKVNGLTEITGTLVTVHKDYRQQVAAFCRAMRDGVFASMLFALSFAECSHHCCECAGVGGSGTDEKGQCTHSADIGSDSDKKEEENYSGSDSELLPLPVVGCGSVDCRQKALAQLTPRHLQVEASDEEVVTGDAVLDKVIGVRKDLLSFTCVFDSMFDDLDATLKAAIGDSHTPVSDSTHSRDRSSSSLSVPRSSGSDEDDDGLLFGTSSGKMQAQAKGSQRLMADGKMDSSEIDSLSMRPL